MAGLNTIGRLSYNGIVFDGALEANVTVDAVMDEAGQTIMYHRNLIRAKAVVTNANGTDANMESIRRKLLEPARELIFTGKGFGNDMIVGPEQDVANGPMPRMLKWTHLGANKACEFEWEVVACVPRCDTTQALAKGIMSLAYDISWSIDEHGMTTKSYSGYIQIAQGRNGRRPRDTADAYLKHLTMVVPEGFKRTSSRTLSKDRSRLDFTITDVQIPSDNPWPEHMTMVRGRHRDRWQRGPNGAILMNTINLDLSPKLGISGTQAWAVFLSIVKARVEHAHATNGSKCTLLDSLEADEDLFGKPCGFSVNYRILGSLKDGAGGIIPGFVSLPGLWKPLDGQWSKWKASMADVFDLRGLKGDTHTASTDLIIDLCEQSTPPFVSPPIAHPPRPYEKKEYDSPYTPDKDSSYLQYRQSVTPSFRAPIIRQSPTQPYSPSSDNGGGASQDGYPTFPAGGATKDILQEGGAPRYSITLRGFAERAGYPIAKPTLKTSLAGGAVSSGDFKQAACTFTQVVANSSFGVPVYTAAWIIEYMLAGTPGQVKAPTNIAEGLT